MKNKKSNLHQDILFILISSFVVVVAWIGSNIYHIYITSTISEEVQSQLTPIDGAFDTQTLQNLKSRERVNPAFEIQATASQAARTPTPTPEQEPITEPDSPSASESTRLHLPIRRLLSLDNELCCKNNLG
jgi:hypothetical protein